MALNLKANVIFLLKILMPNNINFVLNNPKKRAGFILNSIISFQRIVHQAAPAASASYSMIASLLLFIFIGIYIDNYFGLKPFGTIIGLLFGLIIGFYQLVKMTFFMKK